MATASIMWQSSSSKPIPESVRSFTKGLTELRHKLPQFELAHSKPISSESPNLHGTLDVEGQLAVADSSLSEIEKDNDELFDFISTNQRTATDVRHLWRILRELLGTGVEIIESEIAPREEGERLKRAIRHDVARIATMMRGYVTVWPEFADELPKALREHVLIVRVTPWSYLRSMWNLFWSALRHPFSETTIDLSTGRVLYRT